MLYVNLALCRDATSLGILLIIAEYERQIVSVRRRILSSNIFGGELHRQIWSVSVAIFPSSQTSSDLIPGSFVKLSGKCLQGMPLQA
jgi:hypothetical protein